MSFDLQQILVSKSALRRELAARSVAEKLRMLDALRERELAIRGRAVHQRPARRTRALPRQARMKPCLEPLRSLARQLVALQAEARALGLFANDRELLACPCCGLVEDVTCTGLLITCRPPALGEDTGLRFEEIKTGKFRCPQCGGIVAEIPEKPTAKTRPARRSSRK